MSKLAETETPSFWGVDYYVEITEECDTASFDEVEADEPSTFRSELFAAQHLMPVNGGHVHYGTPEGYGNTDIPICRQGHGHHRISYYRPVDLPVSCTNCIRSYGTEA